MSTKKRHQDCSMCPLAGALDIIGDHWTLLVIRDLMFFEKHEYKDLLASREGISTNILADRLARLSEAGLIASAEHPESKRRKLYYVTQSGKDLIPALLEITRWGYQQQKKKPKVAHIEHILTTPTKTIQKQTLKSLAAWEKDMGITN